MQNSRSEATSEHYEPGNNIERNAESWHGGSDTRVIEHDAVKIKPIKKIQNEKENFLSYFAHE